MTEKPTVVEAISSVAATVGAVGKNMKMEAGPARYQYRGLDDLMDAVHGPLTKYGVTFSPHNIQMLDSLEKQTRSGSTQYHLRAIVTYRIYGPAGDYIEASVLAEGADTGDKAGNKLMSGALKYALSQVLSLPYSMEDQDATTPEQVVTTQMPATKQEALDHLQAIADTLERTKEDITAKWRGQNGDITLEQFEALPLEKSWPLIKALDAYVASQKGK